LPNNNVKRRWIIFFVQQLIVTSRLNIRREEPVMKRSLISAQLIRLLILCVAGLAVIGCIPRAATDAETAYQDSRMSPSVTYVHLLRHTPFFTELNDEQLKWVTRRSREWDAPAGTVIDSCASGISASSDLWILLDGGWQVETQNSTYSADNAAPGKWYSCAATRSENRLIATQRSYVMRIKSADMADMLSKGFMFERHLSAGRVWYEQIDAARSGSR
jgi:hypothetical protein